MNNDSTTRPRPTARSTRQRPGEGFSTDNYAPRMVERPSTRVCEVCGASLEGRRRQTRFCCPTCCARASDARHNRTSHAATGKRPRRAREV